MSIYYNYIIYNDNGRYEIRDSFIGIYNEPKEITIFQLSKQTNIRSDRLYKTIKEIVPNCNRIYSARQKRQYDFVVFFYSEEDARKILQFIESMEIMKTLQK